MDKVGIITFHCAHNYGAVLQAYALKRTVQLLGYDSHLIDFRHPLMIKSHALFRDWKDLRSFVLNTFTILRYHKRKTRWSRFEQFMQEFLNLSEKRYSSYEELLNNPPPYDAFICGSDQIWNPHSRLDHAYFLGFALKCEAKRVAYAPSFGVTSVPDNRKEMLSDLISNIPHLSVRERQGRSIIKKLTDRDAEIVIDPSLLLTSEQWKKMAITPDIQVPYILVYCLDNSPVFFEVLRELKRKTNLMVVVVAPNPASRVKHGDHFIYDAGPREFLGLVNQAKCVCTNSFHGMAFSIAFQKPFYTVPHSLVNSRLSNLLECLKLSKQQLTSSEQVPADPLKLDFIRTNHLLKLEREKAIHFLKSSLEQ
ncbi:polysaccharide pyruvyl transferase family protein [Desulfobacula toluolica]|uniref:Conserved uncharacterized protein n=1 Tax=Desulfobacula toluolica (strain DSM 7467 / Tol2) TaxID=651182 RepID=K0NGM2_DESTT|nr:polysaccharide pyruvyl transferase family protein [Desulfobacula toluolica]CCK78988.1 conserved uncharacterized protein [Desulfobacula toluolica Tol2]